jgi:two-component system, chemotaxis family, protein-glutamate methylesterase/glutaminase
MRKKRKIRVLVIDDSLFMRQMVSDILNSDPLIEVIDTAISGDEGLKKIELLKPDVVTLDYEMPGLNGVATLVKIMCKYPVPVVMISAHTIEGGEITLEALSQGAIDYVLKPSGAVSLDIKKVGSEIIDKVKVASKANVKAISFEYSSVIRQNEPLQSTSYKPHTNRAVAIGSSTGGTKGVELILASMPADFPLPIFVVQHMPAMFITLFADRLNRLAKIKVKEGEDGEEVKGATVYMAPGDWHMEVRLADTNKNKNESRQTTNYDLQTKVVLTKDPPVYGLRPSVDNLMRSIARVYGENGIGVILSGMGSDGASGMSDIFKSGGHTIAQNEETSVVFGMPRRAIEAGAVDDVLPIESIAGKIMECV